MCGDDKIYKEVRNNVKNKTDSAEATLREVKRKQKMLWESSLKTTKEDI